MSKAEDITSIREKLGITRKEFSDALYFSKEQEKLLKEWETGKVDIPEDIYNKIMSFPTEVPFKNKPLEECRFKQIDLFAGIGGIRLAFQRHGGYNVYSSECDKFAQTTYRINFGETPDGDITVVDENDIPDHDILLAGFPCQPFSQAGLHKGFEDTRGTLFFDVARIIKAKRPKAFMLENVKQLKGHDNGKTIRVMLSVLDELNYYVPNPQVLNAYHFGVPQNRERIIIVGYRKDLILKKSFFDYLNEYIEEAPTLKDLFKDLPSIKAGKMSNKYSSNCSSKFVKKYIRNKDSILTQHIARPHNENDLKIYKLVLKAKKKGKNLRYVDIPIELQTHSNTNSFLDRYKALDYYSISHTIVAHISKDGHYYIHPDLKQNRSITVREAARIQSFPDDFYFEYSRTAAFKQIGNAVPPVLSLKIASAILDFLKKDNKG